MFVDLISVQLKVRSFLEHEEAATDVLTEAYTLVLLGSKCSLQVISNSLNLLSIFL